MLEKKLKEAEENQESENYTPTTFRIELSLSKE